MQQKNIFSINKAFWDCITQRSDVKPSPIALFYWIVEKFNRLHWKEIIGLPTDEAMEVLGISNYKTYKKNLDYLSLIGAIEVVEWSKNQYTSNKIKLGDFAESALVKNTKASPKHVPKQVQSIVEARTKASPKHCYHNKTIKDYKDSKDLKTIKNQILEEEKEEINFSEIDFSPPIDLNPNAAKILISGKYVNWVENLKNDFYLLPQMINEAQRVGVELNNEKIMLLLEEFFKFCKATGKLQHQNYKSFKNHFKNWSPKNDYHKLFTNEKTAQQKQRRGKAANVSDFSKYH